MSLDGLGNYSRNAGFVTGSVTGGWEPYKLTQDRGRSFMVDVMDNDETMGMAFGTLAGEFIRTQVTPEIDAYRFSKYAGTSGISSGTPADITVGTTDVPSLIQEAETALGDDEVPEEGRILFISETAYAGLKDKITRYVQNGERGIETAIDYYDGMRVIKVPKGRFNTGITLNDGLSAGEQQGGFTVPASTSYPINFMIIHPSAVVQIAKHVVPRIFSPQVNQSADAWKFDYRIYHDCFVEKNKVAGIYLHRAATANT
nr:MAG TPA: Major capsid protein [Caudoviricetes sp.]